LINIICERCLLVGYVDEAHRIDQAMAEEAVNDLRMEEVPESTVPQAGHPMGDGLLMRMGARIESIEQKLDMLVQMLSRAGLVRPADAETNHMKQYLDTLRRAHPSTGPKLTESPGSAKPTSPLRKLPRAGSSGGGHRK
jgi:hypothetical protein